MGTRVWHLEAIPLAEIDEFAPRRRTLGGSKALAIDYDEKGRVHMSNLAGRPPPVNVSQHALERLFERLRTNALDDVVREALIPLSRLGPPSLDDGGKEEEIPLPGLGHMPAKVERACDATGLAIGQIKTFVPLPLARLRDQVPGFGPHPPQYQSYGLRRCSPDE